MFYIIKYFLFNKETLKYKKNIFIMNLQRNVIFLREIPRFV